MSGWVTCPTCGLAFQEQPSGCPRCNASPDAVGADWAAEQARVVSHAEGALEPRFLAPVILIVATAVLCLVGFFNIPSRLYVSGVLVVVGASCQLWAGLWNLLVAWRLGVWWLVGTILLPVIGLVALVRAGNFRPLWLSIAAAIMVGAGLVMFPGTFSAVQDTDAVTITWDNPTADEYAADCLRTASKARCDCLTPLLFGKNVDEEERTAYLNGKAPGSRLADLVKSCPE